VATAHSAALSTYQGAHHPSSSSTSGGPKTAKQPKTKMTDASMRPYLRASNLFVREIDPSLPRDAVVDELTAYCPPSQGKVVVPVSDTTGSVLGIAYLNYFNQQDGALFFFWLAAVSKRAPGARFRHGWLLLFGRLSLLR
jgi:hypothetical protein